MLRRLTAALAFVVAVPLFAHDPVTLERLTRLGRIWGTVEYAHPYLGYREIDWETAGVRAIEKTLAAGTDGDFAAAAEEMLWALGDRETRVVVPCADPLIGMPPGIWKMLDQETIYIEARAEVDAAMKDALRASSAAIVDLRAGIKCSGAALAAELEPLLHRSDLAYPRHRQVFHNGYRSQETGDVFPGYYSGFVLTEPAIGKGSDTKVNRVVFLVDNGSNIPAVALALAHSGRATFLSVGPFTGKLPINTTTFDGEPEVVIRTSELVDANGRSMEQPAATIVLPATAAETAVMKAALELASSNRRRISVAWSARPRPEYQWKHDPTYPEMRYPPAAYRVLAAFRIWNVINYFYGYPHLIGDWDAQFPKIVEQLLVSSTATEYELALAAIMTLVPDGHSGVNANAFADLRGRARPPFFLMPVQGKPVVVEVLHSSATAAGVAPGDELLAIDGRSVQQRMNELRPYISASTDAALEYYVVSSVPNGPPNSRPVFQFRKPNGSVYTATLTRGSYALPEPATPWRILDGNIGYVDLRYLEVEDIPAMFAAMQGTKGLILDIRSYPRGVFPALGRAMNRTGSTVVSQLRVPQVLAGHVTPFLRMQDLGKNAQPSYTAPSLALIDERAQSQSEHTCLTLEAVAGTRFVGSPTVGANGNISYLSVPGNILIRFTGMDVRHADGRQLQRVGVLPHFPVPRTIAALAAGRDEVLEKALEILRNQ